MPRVSVPGVGGGLVQARGLRKSFGAFEAVRGVDVDVARGEVFGFLGPNGAGKSSTMRMIACVSPRSGGTLQVLGRDPDVDGPVIRARIGVVPQLDNLDPELLLLDEPTTGLDPQARHVLWDKLYRLKQQGVTLVLTTHYMDEAEQLCAAGTNADQLPSIEGIGARTELLPDRLLIYADDGESALKAVHACGVQPQTALVRRAGLEDVFLTLTGRTLVD